MSVFLRALVWLSRIGYCRGFGIQSPWAYGFVRYVVNEHFPYYKYGDMEKRFPCMDAVSRKLGKFYLRLANFMQPKNVVAISFRDEPDEYVEAYVHAGCKRCEFTRLSCSEDTLTHVAGDSLDDGNCLYIMDAPCFSTDELNAFLQKLKDGDFVIIERTHGGKENNKTWMDEIAGIQGVLIFDLFYCHVIYVDRKRYTHKYIINF